MDVFYAVTLVVLQSKEGKKFDAGVQDAWNKADYWVASVLDISELLRNPRVVLVEGKRHHDITDGDCLTSIRES